MLRGRAQRERNLRFLSLWNPFLPFNSRLTSGNHEDRIPAGAARGMLSMPERCSPARVRSAAPKAARPCQLRAVLALVVDTTGGSGGNTIQLEMWRRESDGCRRPIP